MQVCRPRAGHSPWHAVNDLSIIYFVFSYLTMNFLTFSGLATIFWFCSSYAEFFVELDCTHDKREPFKRFWTSTGFRYRWWIPMDFLFDQRVFSPTPINNISTFLLSKDEEINLALIGAVPNSGITHARIHWLLDLININCTYVWMYGEIFFTEFCTPKGTDKHGSMISRIYFNLFHGLELMAWVLGLNWWEIRQAVFQIGASLPATGRNFWIISYKH